MNAPNYHKLLHVWKWSYRQYMTAFHALDNPQRLAELDRWNAVFTRADRLRVANGIFVTLMEVE